MTSTTRDCSNQKRIPAPSLPLVAGVLAVARFVLPAIPAHAACTSPGGTTLSCTGDITGDLVSGGLDRGSPYDAFNVNNLTNPHVITPTGAFVQGMEIHAGDEGVGINLTTDADIDTPGVSGANAFNNAKGEWKRRSSYPG